MNKRERDTLAFKIVGSAIAVHDALGACQPEMLYHECLIAEFRHRGIDFLHHVPITVRYRDIVRERGMIADFIVEDSRDTILVEVKRHAVLHSAGISQALGYMRMGKFPRGMVLNFGFGTMLDEVKHLNLSREFG